MKRSVRINGHLTSISLEQPFWDALKAIAVERNISVNHLIADIDERKKISNLSSALRIFILDDLRSKIE